MARSLNLIKNNLNHQEKRTFPRFPFCFLTFKSKSFDDRIFEVRDISEGGMQLGLRDGKHSFKENSLIEGKIHWHGKELNCQGKVTWASKQRLGVAFDLEEKQKSELRSLLSLDNVVEELKPLHDPALGLELPPTLKIWLRADGPIEVFLWQHADGVNSRFQIILYRNFVEWQDGKGLRTGKIHSNREIDTPLVSEDEYTFVFDEYVDKTKSQLAEKLISKVSNIPNNYQDFMKVRLDL